MVLKIKTWLKDNLPLSLLKPLKQAEQLIPKKPNPFSQPSENVLHAYRCYKGQIETLEPVTNKTAEALSNAIVQDPGMVQIDNLTFDLRKDGLYRFYKLPHISEQRIVCQSGIESLLQMSGYLWLYGNKHDFLENSQIKSLSKKKSPVISCGNIAELFISICKDLNIQARRVCTITADNWNGQDDGHMMVEILGEDRKWFLYDPSFHLCFTQNETRLDLLEFSQTSMDDIEFERLSGNQGRGHFEANNYDYGFWIDKRMHSESALKFWYERIKYFPFIWDHTSFEGYVDASDTDHKQRLESFYKIIDREKFIRKFYSSP